MIEKVKIIGFRGFEELEVGGMNRITIVSGENDIGKTSFLEALFFVYDRLNGTPFLKMNRVRGDIRNISIANTWESAFYAMDTSRPIEISIIRDGKLHLLKYEADAFYSIINEIEKNNNIDKPVGIQELSNIAPYALKMTFESGAYREEGAYVFVSGNEVTQNIVPIKCMSNKEEVPPIRFENMFFLSNFEKEDNLLVDLFSRVEIKGATDELLKALNIIDKDIKDISVLSRDGIVQLYVTKNGIKLPFRYCGDGIVKTANVVMRLIADENCILLIDELENGIHYSVQKKLWESILFAANKYNCQVVVTTHSYECLEAACAGIEERGMENEMSYIRLERKKGKIAPEVYTFDDLKGALLEDLEVR